MANLSRRRFLSRVSMTAAASIILPTVGYSASQLLSQNINSDSFVIAPTAYGKLRGLRVNGVNCFKGVAYGGTVSGNRRFKRPGPIEAWTGVKDALELGAPTIQSPRRGEPAPAEDCLFLNVWTPANDHKKRPVMVYTHGGGYVSGSGGAAGQDGANLARNFDVVVVETNHRLGLLGFLYLDEVAGADYTGSGNMGVLDITAALKWVHENIIEFGGDPDNVMIFGESGGGGKTSCLYAMPETAPYFNKASIESGPGVRMLTKDLAAETTERVLKELNITKQNWRKLLDVSPEQLLEVQNKFTFIPPFQEKIGMPEMIGFGPVVDGVTLPNHPFEPTAPDISKDKPLITGWNEDEYAFFIMTRGEGDLTKIDFNALPEKLEPEFGKDTATIIETYKKTMPNATAPQVLMAIKSIALMGLGSVEIAEKKALQKGAPVYLYNFGYKSNMKIPGTDYPMGTPHAMDISFKFNNEVPPKEGDKPFWSLAGDNPDKYIASHKMAELWTSFAKTGVPSAKDVPEWPAYNFSSRSTMRIDTECEVIHNRYSQELDMWRSISKLKTL